MTKAEEIFNIKAEYNKWLKELTDDEKELVLEMINETFRQTDVSGSLLEQIRQAFADYYKSEGCACCRDEGIHSKAEKRLAELLKPDMYEDGSGFNWYLYASNDC